MGSEHYCLRWNNHQSNLLGVFSQLLESESLVDVTLACAEGPSIRAHKVVLSACSSYFQALFLEHPGRHPIVILKDVRFDELRTLVDFMYKGEVNVEYCQLSALLKTAESLKVKGLADMTNVHANTSSSAATSAATGSSNSTVALIANPSPVGPSEPSSAPTQVITPTSMASASTIGVTTEQHVSGDQKRPEPMVDGDEDDEEDGEQQHHHQELERRKRRRRRTSSNGDEGTRPRSNEGLAADEIKTERGPSCSPKNERPESPVGPLALDRPRSRRDSDSQQSLDEGVRDRSPLSPAHSHPSDMSLPNNNNGGASGNSSNSNHKSRHAPSSPPSSEPLAGPSGLPPVQQVPLSLKKEVDWERSTEDRSASSEMSSDYRLPPDPELMGMDERVFACMYCGASFLHQSKLTRHILSHSLESLKYREQAAHLQLQAQLGLEPVGLHGLGPGPEPHYPGPGAGGGGAVSGGTGPLLGGPLAGVEPMDLELAGAVHSDPGSGVVLCKFCGKSFPDVGSLISHLPAHTGDRPFKCEFCGKAFKLRHHMKDHCRVHTGERPFRCALCGKTFSRSTILKAHEKTHYPKYVRKFLSPSPVEPVVDPDEATTGAPPNPPNPHSAHH
ncbi:hypothetical protein QAD02_010523 [Eretmocerus hayati]|uniref:Uncharacterized protein n=1 Tax=Eretmocerus hayati TaxID=131215 RepID=A0ACC2NUC1_9HYME|nr:hypothetical protein QAD02_010523 [Eretmocerus hayati]